MAELLLSDSATYLINRMLESDKVDPLLLKCEASDSVTVRTVLSSHRSKDDPEDSGVCEDSRSEAGTYTLAVEHKNVEVEHARQMIDVVFGVSDKNKFHVSSGFVPGSTACMAKEIEKSQASGSCNQDTGAHVEMLRELRQRTFTRPDGRRSTENKSSFKMKEQEQSSTLPSNNASARRQELLIKPSIENKIKAVFHSERIRHDSAGSSRTIEIKSPAVLRKPPASASNSPLLQRKNFAKFSSSASSTPRPGSPVSLNASFDSDPIFPAPGTRSKNGGEVVSNLSPLKLNRAFALRRARLGLESPGVALDSNEEKQKRNLENKSSVSSGSRIPSQIEERSGKDAPAITSNFNRRDGGRFSLRPPSRSRNVTPVRSSGKPPIPSHSTCDRPSNDFSKYSIPSHSRPASTNRNQSAVLSSNGRTFRAHSESKALVTRDRVSPAASSCSISQCQSVQRSCSFSPAGANGNVSSHAMSAGRSLDYSSPFLRGISPLRSFKRILNNKTHQTASDARQSHRQQANVVPIKRSPADAIYSREASSPNSNHPSPLLHRVILSPQSTVVAAAGEASNSPHHHHAQTSMTCSVHESEVMAGCTSPSVPMATPTYLCQNQAAGGSLSRSGRSLSALDSLVLSAILQLSMKLRNAMKELLQQERLKHSLASETRMMIDEILPQVACLESLSGQTSIDSMTHENLSKDLSSVLKNLKRVEQSIEALETSTPLTNRLSVTLRESAAHQQHLSNPESSSIISAGSSSNLNAPAAHNQPLVSEPQENQPSPDLAREYSLEY